MQRAAHQPADQQMEMSLREHLLAASTGAGSAPSPYPSGGSAHHAHDHSYPPPPDGVSHDNHHLDPNATGSLQYAMGSDGAGDDALNQEARKGKRELSTSKRAAQNRAAQRAFRQRKEGYIKKLEEQVKEFQNMEGNYKALQNENYQLREYILNLQSRLLENQSEFPPAPSHIHLSSGPAPPAAAAAESSYAAEQQLRREMDQRQAPPAPVLAREDARDGPNQLLAAAAHESRASQHQSPYGLNDYPSQHPQPGAQMPHQSRSDEAPGVHSADVKPAV